MIHPFLTAEELGIRLEIVAGLPIWEDQPVYKHQKAVDRIRHTIQPMVSTACACIHIADVYVLFADGSLKRPDISIFCEEPQEEDSPIALIPQAVIEVISKGYEAKDLDIGPQFYLAQGVKDVVVFNPYTLAIWANRLNDHRVEMDWRFTTEGARIKLRKLYPK